MKLLESADSEVIATLEKALAGEKLSLKEVTLLLESRELKLITLAADELRSRQVGDLVTFVIDTNINYTNACVSACKFCAFYRAPGSSEAYTLSVEEILEKIARAVKLGATQVLLQGGLNPELSIEYYEEVLKRVRERFPQVQRHFFSPSEIVHIAKVEGLSIREVLSRLKEAGLQSMPGGGAEILSDRIRREVSPNKISWREWREVMLVAHELGIPTTATMVFGLGESNEDRARHLLRLREMQEATHGFTAFIPWSFKPGNTALAAKQRMYEAGGIDYLTVVAVARLVLGESFRNIQASWLTQGERMAQLALCSGANDFGGTMIEENVVKATGYETRYLPPERIVALIKQISRPAAQRDTLYNILRRFQ
jgi:cyclic dehypoxanthinyl futalosine synthase